MSLRVSKNMVFNSLFFGYLIFMGTTLKLTLGLSSISFIFTASVILLPILIISNSVRNVNLNWHDVCILFATSVMVILPLINVLIYFSGPFSLVQALSFLFPWLVFMSALLNRQYVIQNQSKFWEWFNKFSIVLLTLGLIEYVACIFFGIIPPFKETANGEFFVGWFTVFHALDPSTPHFRFYGPFGEPGELAMWASVLIFYNLFRKNYLPVIIISISAFAAFSPSILVSFIFALVVFSIARKNVSYVFVIFILIPILIVYFSSELISFIQSIYTIKASSLASRYEWTIGFFGKFQFLVHSFPFGTPAFETSHEAFSSGINFAANFSPIEAFQRGGIIVFVLYLLFLGYGTLISLIHILKPNKNLIDCEIYMYFIILLPFVFQRGTIFELGIFPLIFAGIFFHKKKRSFECITMKPQKSL